MPQYFPHAGMTPPHHLCFEPLVPRKEQMSRGIRLLVLNKKHAECIVSLHRSFQPAKKICPSLGRMRRNALQVLEKEKKQAII